MLVTRLLERDYIWVLTKPGESILSSATAINKDKHDNILISNIKHNNKYVSIGHLSTQPMISSFDEFQLMISETWPKDVKPLPKFSYRNRNERGVGLYIKDYIEYKVRHDFTKTDETMKHM